MTSPRFRPSALLFLAAAALAACAGETPEEDADPERQKLNRLAAPQRLDRTAPETYRARFETTEGAFVVEVHRSWAPRGADRFYNLVEAGYYDSVYVHRVLPDRIAQFGIHYDPRITYVWNQSPIQDDPVRESNVRGRLSFAKAGAHSRTTQVFVNLSDNPGLDEEGFAPFGEVVEGMETVDGFYDAYGDGPPRGDGPYPARARARGSAYFESEFPELDRIESARIVGDGRDG